jgi:hypothetical protein
MGSKPLADMRARIERKRSKRKLRPTTVMFIYSKTETGAAEIKARSGELSLSARRVLIMIDGNRTTLELALVVRVGEFEGIIAELLAKGMVTADEYEDEDMPDTEEAGDDQVTVMIDGLARGPDALPALRPSASTPAPISVADRRVSTISSPLPAANPPIPRAAPAVVAKAARRPSTIAVTPDDATREAEADDVTLESRKRAAVKALYERLGPYGEEPAARIYECKTSEALREQLKLAVGRVAVFRGEKVATEYMNAIDQS